MTISARCRPKVIIMVKVPRPGRVKTRLGHDIGMVPAAWWYRHQMKRVVRRISSPKWDTILAVSPDFDGLKSAALPLGLPRISQGNGDLGVRMRRLLNLFPFGPVLIVGSDIPGLSAPHIQRGISTLGAADMVFGPAVDGGYWMVGWKGGQRLPTNVLTGVRWSTEFALMDSVASARGLRVAIAPDVLRDVDTKADL